MSRPTVGDGQLFPGYRLSVTFGPSTFRAGYPRSARLAVLLAGCVLVLHGVCS